MKPPKYLIGPGTDEYLAVEFPDPPGDLELAIEGAERNHSSRNISLPDAQDIVASLSERELKHLELFLMSRDTRVHTPCLEFPALRLVGDDGVLYPGRRLVSYVGPLMPRGILVGDVHNPNYIGTEIGSVSAFGPWLGCGPYLLDALSRDEWREIGILNANEVDMELLRSLMPPSTQYVALGRNTQRACEIAGIMHGVVPHPAYAKRFLSGRCQEYGALILETLESGKDNCAWRG